MSAISPLHENLGHAAKHSLDLAGAGVIALSWMGWAGHWLPPALTFAASLFGLIWYLIQIYESNTFQRHLGHVRARKAVRDYRVPPHHHPHKPTHHKRHTDTD